MPPAIQTQKIDELLVQAMSRQIADPKQAADLLEQTQGLLKQVEEHGSAYLFGQAAVEAGLSLLTLRRGNYQAALRHGMAAISLYEQTDNKRHLPVALGSVGMSYSRLGNNDKGLRYFLMQLDVAESLAHDRSIAMAHLGLGILYIHANEYELAEEHCQVSLGFYQALEDIERQAAIYNNLNNLFMEQGDLQESLKYALLGLELEASGERPEIVFIYLHLSIFRTYLELDRLEQASSHLTRGFELAMQTEDRYLHTLVTMQSGRMAARLGQSADAIEHFQQTVKLSEEAGINVFNRGGHLELHNLYEQSGEVEKALTHYRHYHTACMKLKEHDSDMRLSALSTMHQAEKEQKEAELLRQHAAELQQRVDEQTVQLRTLLAREQQLARSLQQALDRTDMLDKLKSRVMQVVSHEFRTPLTVINGSAQLVTQHLEKMSAEQRLRHLGHIQNAIDELLNLVQNIEVVGDASADRLSPNVQEMTLVRLAERLAANLGSTASDSERLEFEIDASVGDALVFTDVALVERIAAELLTNALKFSQAAVRVLFSAEKNTLDITVQDQGIGLLSDEHERIFELMDRGSNVGTIRGLGVGLYLAQQLANMIGAWIRPKSAGPNQGAQFSLRIPYNQPKLSRTNP